MPGRGHTTGGAAGNGNLARWAMALVAALLALALAWQIVAVAAARLNAQDQPDEALRWRPAHAAALSRKAELAYPEAALRGTTKTVEATAQRALLASPLEVTALRLLGAVADVRGDRPAATRLMSLAAERSLRDVPAQLWMFHYEMARQNYTAAFHHGEALMHAGATRQSTTRAMAAAAVASPKARQALVQVMRRSPDIRQGLARELSINLDASELFNILADLKDAGAVISDSENAALAKRMLRDGEEERAYLAWVQLLPAEARAGLGNVYDGDFSGLPGAGPFAWSQHKDMAEIAPGPDGPDSTLAVHYPSERPATLSEQMILLAPGRYRLRLRAQLEEPGRGDQLHWTVACPGKGAPKLVDLAAPDEAQVWTDISVEFVVPEGGCKAQLIQLTGRPGDHVGFVQAWFDGVIIEPLGSA
jgi:hypothetical protein